MDIDEFKLHPSYCSRPNYSNTLPGKTLLSYFCINYFYFFLFLVWWVISYRCILECIQTIHIKSSNTKTIISFLSYLGVGKWQIWKQHIQICPHFSFHMNTHFFSLICQILLINVLNNQLRLKTSSYCIQSHQNKKKKKSLLIKIQQNDESPNTKLIDKRTSSLIIED